MTARAKASCAAASCARPPIGGRHGVEIDRALQVQADRRLGAQHALDRRVDLRLRQSSAGERRLDAVERGNRIRRVQHLIGAGQQRADRAFVRRHHLGHRVHRHRVGVDEAAEPHLGPQQVVKDRPAEGRRRRRRRIERRQHDVRRHHRLGALLHAAAERQQLDAVEPRAIVGDHRQAEMAVDVGVAVAGEMLDRRDHPAVARAGDVGADQRGDALGVLAVRPDVDHRVARVVVDVGDRREVDLHAERARLDRR